MPKPQSPPLLDEVKHFDLRYEAMRHASERRAWWVAGFTSVLSLVLALGYWWVMPLKTNTPYVVMVDTQSGTSHVARLTANLEDLTITQNDAVNKSNVARFVIAREAYDWGIPNKNNWRAVFAMSSPPVAEQFKRQFDGNSAENPDVVWGKNSIIRIKLKSIVLLGKDNSNKQTPTGASVRFNRYIINRQSQQEQLLDSKIATLDFNYNPNLQMPEEARFDNPLGFQVGRYGTDIDLSEPVAVPNAPPAAATPNNADQKAPQAGSITSNTNTVGETK